MDRASLFVERFALSIAMHRPNEQPATRQRFLHARRNSLWPLAQAEALLQDFAHFWDEEPSPLERRKLISTLLDRVCQ